jgi:hypothetical protein
VLLSPDQPPHVASPWRWWWPPASSELRRLAELLSRRHPIDRFGDLFQVLFAIFFGCFVAWPISIMEIAAAPLAVCWVLRLPFTLRAHATLFRQWPAALWLGLFLWQTLSLLHAGFTHASIDQWGGFRYALLVPGLYLVARHRGWVLVAASIGFLIANAAQLLAGIAPHLALGLGLLHRSSEGRIGGWWPEVIAGEVLVAALGIHLGALMHATSRGAVAFGVIGGVASLAGIIVTGTRGAWIAAAVLVGLWAIVMVAKASAKRRRVLLAWFVVGVCIVVAAIAVNPATRRRLVDARNETSRVVERGESQTNIGLRVRMLEWGWQAFVEHPWMGVGPGGFRPYVLARASGATGDEVGAIAQFEREGHGHCHNALVQVLASSGLPAGLLLIAATVASLVAGFARGAAESHGPSFVRAYAAAAPWMLLGMVLVWPFDAVTLSVQTCAMMMLAAGLCPGWIAREPAEG